VKAHFHDADLVGEKTVFNVANNRYRLIAFVAFRTQIVYIKQILSTRNEEALAVVESLLKRGEAKLNAEEIALLDLLGTLIVRIRADRLRSAGGRSGGSPGGSHGRARP
jgi:hypothetical protein